MKTGWRLEISWMSAFAAPPKTKPSKIIRFPGMRERINRTHPSLPLHWGVFYEVWTEFVALWNCVPSISDCFNCWRTARRVYEFHWRAQVGAGRDPGIWLSARIRNWRCGRHRCRLDKSWSGCRWNKDERYSRGKDKGRQTNIQQRERPRELQRKSDSDRQRQTQTQTYSDRETETEQIGKQTDVQIYRQTVTEWEAGLRRDRKRQGKE